MRKGCNLTNSEDIKELKTWLKDYVTKGEEGARGGVKESIIVNLIDRVKISNPEWVPDVMEAVRSVYGNDVVENVSHIPQDPELVGEIAPKLSTTGLVNPFRVAKSREDNDKLMDPEESGGSHNFDPDKTDNPGIYSWLGSEQFNAVWFDALGMTIDESKMPMVFYNAKLMSWPEFSNWATAQGADPNKIPRLRKLWLLNQDINNIALKNKKSWVYANIQNMLGPNQPNKKVKYFKREHEIVDPETGDPISLKTQNKLPVSVNKNFIDGLQTKVRGKSVGDVTHYFPLNKVFNVIWNKKTKSWFSLEDAANIGLPELLEMQADHLMNNGVMLVGMSASDKGNIMGVELQAGHVDIVLNRDSVIKAMEKDVKLFGQDFINDIKNTKYKTIAVYYRKMKDQMLARKKRGTLTADARKIFNNFHILLTTIAKDNFKAYLLNERKNGVSISDTDMNNFMDNVLKVPRNKRSGEMKYPAFLQITGLIAKHEWYKAVRGNKYLEYGSLHTFNRMRLSATDGFVPLGAGPTKHIIIDPSTVDIYLDGVKVDNFKTLRGLTGNTNLMDGLSMVSTAKLDRTANAVGIEQRYNNDHAPREFKTVILHLSPDMKSYVEFKHSEQEAYDNMEIVKKGKNRANPDNVMVYTQNVQDEIIIYSKGERIDMITDTDGAKTFYGDFKVGKLFELPESSRRVIIAPSSSSNPDVYGPIQYLNSLHSTGLNREDRDALEPYAEAMYNIIEGQSKKYLDSWIDAAEDPDLLRDLAARIYSEQNQAKDNVKNKLLARSGAAIHHSDSLFPIRRMLLNSLIFNGSMQGRTYRGAIDKNKHAVDTAGSDYFLKPYLGDKIRLVDKNGNEDLENGVPEGIILSSGSSAIRNYIARRLDPILDVNNQPLPPTIADINSYLRDNPMYVLTYRSPILKLDSIAPRKIMELTLRDDGNAVYHHPLDVGIRLVGDFDIDEAGVIVVPDNIDIKTLWDFQFSKIFQRSLDASAELSIFDVYDSAALSDHDSMVRDMVTTMKGHNAQGRMTNLKNLTNNIAHHIKKITFYQQHGDNRVNDGVELVPKLKNSKTVMNYAPLKKGVNEKTLRDLGWSSIASIKTIDGVNYLETTVEHELNLILNAAVDHPKLNMLTKAWGFNMEDESGNLWLLQRMFKVKNSDILTEKHAKMINGAGEMRPMSIKSIFNMSNIRKGKDANHYQLSEVNFMNNLKKLHTFLNMSSTEQKAYLETVEWALDRNSALRMDIEMRDLDDSNKLTYEEKHALLPYQTMLDKYDGNPPDSPYDYDESREAVASYKARDFLKKWVSEKYGKLIGKAEYQAAKLIARNFMIPFYKIVGDKHHNNNTISFDKQLGRLLETSYNNLLTIETKYEMKDGSLIPEKKGMIRAIITSIIMGGIDARNISNVLPFQDMLSDEAMSAWGQEWERLFFSRDGDGNLDMVKPEELESLKDAGFNTIDLINEDLC